ncbi:urease accessory protein UreD [Wenxinia saemankumensis]|uniref:Urease accessory protein UreD n=1 Tax=Wenxinia saemankumensis TaxID=1447782 RepID=A0A1M6ANE5_9RHOB|nr:urease accessory protein UreD [Wenxinia saemankumensis]SHI38006.1 urease accessory protein [Wenxinia saemankumensis]
MPLTLAPAAPPGPEPAVRPVPRQPRAAGAVRLDVRGEGARSRVARFRAEGAMRALFPARPDEAALEAILVNTAGGLTSGDRLFVTAGAGPGAALTLTTQAAERAYRAPDGPARVRTALSAAAGSRLDWLPQELILYDGARLDRRLEIDLAPGARLLAVEPVILGRAAMGEVLRGFALSDRVTVRRGGAPLWIDATDLTAAALDRPAALAGLRAYAALIYVAPDAEAQLAPIRDGLPEAGPAIGGASLIAADTLVLRLLAEDGFALRRALLPVLDRLTRDTLPRSWRL